MKPVFSLETKNEATPALSGSLETNPNEIAEPMPYYRDEFYDEKKVNENAKIFNEEINWQIMSHLMLNEEKRHYKTLIKSRSIPKDEERFVENPFYFSNRSFAHEDNGYGDHYLYGVYAGYVQNLLIDKEGLFLYRDGFLKQSVNHHLTHKNSLLSSASTTQLVRRINKSMSSPSVLNLLRPKDPEVKKRMMDRHLAKTTVKKDRNKESMRPYVANINFPPQLPISFDESDLFPSSMKKFILKQYKKKLGFMSANKSKSSPITPKHRFHNETYPFRLETDMPVHRVNSQTQTIDYLFPGITRSLRDRRHVITLLKDRNQMFVNGKRIPLCSYRYFNEESFPKRKYKGFYDMQPKVKSPWLTKVIKNGTFTRKYYLENFKTNFDFDIGDGELRKRKEVTSASRKVGSLVALKKIAKSK